MRHRASFTGGAAVLGLLALGIGGCFLTSKTIGSGESARTWKAGKLIRVYNLEYDQVWNAAITAVREMKLTVELEEHDAFVGQIRVRRTNDISARIDLNNLGSKQTRLSIFHGAIGRERDQQGAMVIMDAIDKKLEK